MSKTKLSMRWNLIESIDHCKNLRSFMQIHSQLVTSGSSRDQLISKKMVDFFSNYSEFSDYAFDFLKQLDRKVSSFPCNNLIQSYAGNNKPQQVIAVYRRLVRDGFLPDKYTFPVILKSCAKFFGFGEGREIHGVIFKMGFVRDLYVQNALIHFYGACGDLMHAVKVFDEMLERDVVSWTGLISGYARAGLFDEAIAFFLRMDVEPNIATLITMLVVCGRNGSLSMGMGIHGMILKQKFIDSTVANAIVDMYVKNGCFNEAKGIFYDLSERDIVSWTSLITGLVQYKNPKEALQLFSAMLSSGVSPDKIILTSVLSACASLGTLDFGKWVHEYIDCMAIECDTHIATAMIDMYAKCGCINMALQVFDKTPCKNVFTWNALLCGLAMHGKGREALYNFENMVRFGPKPNEVTFLAILTACCHSGFVDEGQRYFALMSSQFYNLPPRLEHYGCMVDLLCKAGLLNKALELINTMSMKPDMLIWGSVLSACKSSRNIDLSRAILDSILDLQPRDSGVYVLLSNIFATNGRWAEVMKIRKLMKNKNVEKAPGLSVIEVDGQAHEFIVGESSHPQNKDISNLLNLINNVSRGARPVLMCNDSF